MAMVGMILLMSRSVSQMQMMHPYLPMATAQHARSPKTPLPNKTSARQSPPRMRITDTLTYTLGGTDAAAFSIVSTSGQLQTKNTLDFETKNTYTVTVAVADGNGGSGSITVTINVTDVNEAPRFSKTQVHTLRCGGRNCRNTHRPILSKLQTPMAIH